MTQIVRMTTISLITLLCLSSDTTSLSQKRDLSLISSTSVVYDRDKYNKCSISIRYCGTLLPHAWLIDPNTSCKSAMQQRAALLNLLVQLRGLYPSAKILGASELDGKELYSKNIIVSDTMNVLREELSDMP